MSAAPWIVPLTLACTLLLDAASPAGAAPSRKSGSTPSAASLLERVRTQYRDLWSYSISGQLEVQISTPAGNQENLIPFLLAADSSGRFREQLSGMPASYGDGTTEVMYVPADGRFVRRAATRRPAEAGIKTREPSDGFARRYLGDLRGAIGADSGARVLRAEPLLLGDEAHNCWVLEVPMLAQVPNLEMSPRTLWVDQKRMLVLQQRLNVRTAPGAPGPTWERTETISVRRIRVNQAQPDTLFAFIPPAGAREVSSLDNQGVDLTGHEAADFTLNDLDGKPVTLKDLRGKVVLLDFWATWCGPCRIEMPRLEALHKELKAKGLVVLGINQREEATRARAYIERSGYSFPILLDKEGVASDAYQVSAIPTLLVIDKAGKVSSHFVGLREESVLREAIAKAGL
jgi:peroxiredoxin